VIRVRSTLSVLRYAAASGFADLAVVYTWRTWTLGWLSRVLCQVAFFALIGRLLGSPEATRYLLIGNAALIAVLEATFVVASTTWERRAGTLPLLVAAPGNPVVVFFGRSVQWLVTGTASSSIALLVLTPVFGFHLPLPTVLLAIPITATVAWSAFALALLLAAAVLRATQLRNVVGNITWWVVALLAGVQVPTSFWPRWMQTVAVITPATHGLHGIRAVMDGDASTALRDAGIELAVGAGWLVLAAIAFQRFAESGRRDGSIEFGD
jgi:ABC-2 type transport system permease protein